MPKQVTLTHCEPLQIYPELPAQPGPPTVDLDVHVVCGGTSGDGVVDVHQDGEDGPIAGSVQAGEQDDIPVSGTQGVWLHYVREEPDGPMTIDVEYEYPEP